MAFVTGLTDDQRRELVSAGFDLSDVEAETMPQFHKLFTPYEDGHPENESRKIPVLMSTKERDDGLGSVDFAVFIAARIIDAFDCTTSKEARLHCDCMRLAVGYPSCGSQQDIARKYGKSKAFVSYRVRSIQKRLDLPLCVFNGNRTNR